MDTLERVILFDTNEKFLADLNVDTFIPEEVEGIDGENRLLFDYHLDEEDADLIKNGCLVAIPDLDGGEDDYLLFEIVNLSQDDTILSAECNHDYYSLSKGDLVTWATEAKNATTALELSLANERYQLGTIEVERALKRSQENVNPLESLRYVEKEWGGELRFRATITGNYTINRYVDLFQQRGHFVGNRFEFGHNMEDFDLTIDTDALYTAAYGFGRGAQTEGGEESVLTFEDVEWKVANGDPIDKPLGQKWVGVEDARLKYGRIGKDGSIVHRFYKYDSQAETQEGLLWETWAKLQEMIEPTVNVTAKVIDLASIDEEFSHEKASLGDEHYVIADVRGRPIEMKTRIIKYTRRRKSPTENEVELGSFLPSSSRIQIDAQTRVETAIENLSKSVQVAVESANGKNTNYYTEVEPTDAIKNDLWFRIIDGVHTETYRYDGVRWVPILNLKLEEASDAAARAETAADEAVSKANTVEVTANDAANDAAAAVTAAESAYSKASTAEANANTAITNAQTAMTDAQNAIDDALAANTAASSAQSVANDAKTQAEAAVTDANAALADASTALSNVDSLSTSVDTRFSNVNGELSSKVSQSTYDTLAGTVSNHSTEISQNKEALTSKAEASVVDTLSKTVSSHTTKIEQNTEAITFKATQTSVDALTNTVSQQQATLEVHAEEISAKVNTIDADNKYATQSSLTQTSESLTSEITKVQTNLDNLEVGSTNLYLNSADFNGGWGSYNASVSTVDESPFTKSGAKSRSWTIGSGTSNDGGIYQRFRDDGGNTKFKDGQVYTVTVYAKSSAPAEIRLNLEGGSAYLYSKTTTEWEKLELTFTGNGSAHTITMYATDATKSIRFYVSMPMLVEGSKAGDWQPAPEDMTTSIQYSSLKQTVDSIATTVTKKVDQTTYNSFVEQTSTSLASRITKTDADNLYTTKSSFTQTIDGIQTQVNGKVDNTTYTSFVTQTNNAINARITETDANNKFATQSSLTQTASSLQSRISTTQQSGGNLIIDGGFEDTSVRGGTTTEESRTGKRSMKLTGRSGIVDIYLGNLDIHPGRVYYAEAYIKPAQTDWSGSVGIATTIVNEKADTRTYPSFGYLQGGATGWTKVSGYVRIGGNTEWNLLQFRLTLRENVPTGQVFYFDDVVLEDVTEANRIESDVSSSISQLSDNINLRVMKDNVINAVNISDEGIQIYGNKLHITASTYIDNAVIKSAMIDTLDAAKITTGVLNSDRIAARSIEAVHMKLGTITASSGIIGSLDASKITTGTLDAARIAANTITGAMLTADAINGKTITGVDITSTSGSNSVRLYNGIITSRLNNRDMIKLSNYEAYFYDSGSYDSSPDFGTVATLGNVWDTDNPQERGFGITAYKDYFSIAKVETESSSLNIAKFDFKDNRTIIAGSHAGGGYDGRLTLRASYSYNWNSTTSNARGPSIDISNYNTSTARWGNVTINTGRGPDYPGNDSAERYGFEVWQYRGGDNGTTNGDAKQMLKIDSDAGENYGDNTYTTILTDTVYLPSRVLLATRDNSLYRVPGVMLDSKVESAYGAMGGNPAIWIGYHDITIPSDGDRYSYGYGRFNFSGAQNIWTVQAQVHNGHSSNVVVGVEDMSPSGWTIYVRGTGASTSIPGKTFRVQYMVVYDTA